MGRWVDMRCHSTMVRAATASRIPKKSIPHHERTTPRRHTLHIYAITMSAPSRCLATASRSLKNTPATRIAHRSLASTTSNSITSSWKATGGNTTCLREAQRIQTSGIRAAGGYQGQIRTFSQSASRSKLKTIDQIRARNKGGVCHV
jgi:hypothetical protein